MSSDFERERLVTQDMGISSPEAEKTAQKMPNKTNDAGAGRRREFVEWEEVYAGTCYGTLRSELKRIWDKGHVIVFDVDVKGGVNLKRIFGAQALSVFVMPPSVDELQRRLEGRGTDSPETIARRVAKAEQELAFAPQFDRWSSTTAWLPPSPRRSGSPKRSSDNGPFHAGGNDTLFRVVQPGAPGARGRGRCRIGIDGSRSALVRRIAAKPV
ncbi:unnamed protein product [Mycena citricolor]|uniref:Guanylate kinase-like domain-containing protein n=1 Tax=Mycena citricolor TaxID=2018698 RepID=A0AAD2HED3_9AGAR|nr:unnamed protein product [Mycena citricolor]